MDRDVAVELAKYASINQSYQPQIGDTIIKHGFISRVKWFGIINSIERDGTIKIVKSGTPRTLFPMQEKEMESNTIRLNIQDIKKSWLGTYSAVQYLRQANTVVWYV